MAWWYCWRNPSYQCRFPPFCQMNLSTPPTPLIPHSTTPLLYFFLPYSHCSCPSSTKLMGHITTRTASLSPPTDAISLLETVEGGKMVFKSLFTNGKQNFLGKRWERKNTKRSDMWKNQTSLETLCHHLVRLSYTNLHSAIPPEDVCPWETCTHCPRHIHENIHSSILRNQN